MAYTAWRSPTGILIQAETALFEMSVEDASQLSDDIRALLAPPKRVFKEWTPELIAEVARLYLDEGMGSKNIAKVMEVHAGSIDYALKLGGVTKRRTSVRQANNLVLARATKAKRVA